MMNVIIRPPSHLDCTLWMSAVRRVKPLSLSRQSTCRLVTRFAPNLLASVTPF